MSGIEQGQSDNNQINGNNYNKRFSDNQGQCSPTKRVSILKTLKKLLTKLFVKLIFSDTAAATTTKPKEITGCRISCHGKF